MRRISTLSPSSPRFISWLVVGLVITLPVIASARTCDIDATPAATLLIPYFEVDPAALAAPFPAAAFTTAFTVVNPTATARLAHVTLWTDWAIPTMNFDLYLGPNDVKSVNIQEIFGGEVPGGTQSPGNCAGSLSTGTPHFLPDLRASGVATEDFAKLVQAHAGSEIDLGAHGKIVAGSSHPEVLSGYITIDVVRACTDLFPSDSTGIYFVDGGKGIATNDNALVGDFFTARMDDGVAFGDPAVHLRADASFGQGDYTFYGRYLNGDGRDDRQPVGSLWATRFVRPEAGLEIATDLIIWRDTKSPVVTPPVVGGRPHWRPLPVSATACDEDQHCGRVVAKAPLATQKVHVGSGGGIDPNPTAGWFKLNFGHRRAAPGTTVLFGSYAQAWVITDFDAPSVGGLAGIGLRASRLPTALCKP